MRRSLKKSQSKARAVSNAYGISELELARLGDGQLAYIRVMSPQEARVQFPTIKGLPRTGKLFGVYGADGTPLAITDTHQAAIGHAADGELEIACVH